VALLLAMTPARWAHAEVGSRGRIASVTADDVPELDPGAVSGLAPGQELTQASARTAIRALWSTGRFRDVRVFTTPADGGRVHVRVALVLGQTVRRMFVEGNSAMSRRDVVRATGYIAGERWRPDEREAMVEALQEAYRERGYPDAQVEMEVTTPEDDPEGVSIRMTVDEGEPLRVADLVFRGSLGLPEAQLRQTLGLDEGDVYDRVALREGLTSVLALYRSEGYYRALIDTTRVAALVSAEGEARVVVPVEAGDHYELDFVGNRRIPDEELREALDIDEEADLTSAILDNLAERLRLHYQSTGFHHARVQWRIFQLGPARRRLAFRIRSGPRVAVRRIDFLGNDHFGDRFLRRQVVAFLQERLAPESIFSRATDDEINAIGVTGEGRESWRPGPRTRGAYRVDPRRTYVEDAYREAIEHIRRLYQADGYLGATLSEPLLAFSDRGRQLTVRVRVDEGPQTRIGSITFGGNSSLGDERLEEALELDLDEPLDGYEVELARRRLRDLYRSAGYMFVDVEAEQFISDDGEYADLHFLVDEGDQVVVGEVVVRGHDATRASLIRDRIALRSGDVYSPEAARRSERALVELGIFSTVSISMHEAETRGPIKDVVVEVVERRPQFLEWRIGFSTSDGPRLRLGYGYNNLFGYAVGFRLRAEASYQVFFLGTPQYEEFFNHDLEPLQRLEHLVVASLEIPHLPGVGRYLDFRLDANVHEQDNDPAYVVTRSAMVLSVSARPAPFLTLQLQTGPEFTDVAQVMTLPDCGLFNDPAADDETFHGPPRPGDNCLYATRENLLLSRAPEGASWLWVSRLVLSVDFRDNPFNPTRGFYGSVAAEHVHSLQDIQVPVYDEFGNVADHEPASTELLRLTVLASGYIPLGFLDWVLALSVRFGWNFNLDDKSVTFADRYFYLGGFDDLRGYPAETVPHEPEPTDRDEDGRDDGFRALPGGNSMLLLRGEVRIPLPNNFSLGLFVDAGNIWFTPESLWEHFGLRTSVGFGLRYETPVGPLVFDLAWDIPRPSDENLAAQEHLALNQSLEDFDTFQYYWVPYIHFSIGVF